MATKPLTQTTGRRKEAVARARLRPGNGTHTINGKGTFDFHYDQAVGNMSSNVPPVTILSWSEL